MKTQTHPPKKLQYISQIEPRPGIGLGLVLVATVVFYAVVLTSILFLL